MTEQPDDKPPASPASKDPASKDPASEGERPRKVPLYYNIISHLGTLIVALASALILFALIAQFTVENLNPYVGILTFLVFPGILVFGGLLVLIGMRWEAGRRKRKHALESLPYPKLDLNDQGQRRLFGFSAVGGIIVATIIAAASYQGFLFTESVTFCGETCHVPMQPEFTAYQDSAHARVSCAACHVGEGAGWYVKSKLSGVRQVFAVLLDSYHRPIETPIAHLRPARETCEHCHWPDKFFGSKLLQLPHFRYNETNDAEQITLMLKTGGGSKAHGQSQGIHWHMVADSTVTYAAVDKKLQVIPWMKVKRGDGRETVYTNKKSKLSRAELEQLPKRTMDCMDCHNRPAHEFPTPDSGVDRAMEGGLISSELPYIKKLSVGLLFKDYPDEDSARAAIRVGIENYYRDHYPEVAKTKRKEIESAIGASIGIWTRGVFPLMKVNWTTYPENTGHRYWPGCFRCHNEDHVDDTGKALAHDCNSTCHTEPKRGSLTALGAVDPNAQKEWHPWKMPDEHLNVEGHDVVDCHECHQAGQRPSKECSDCHEK